VIYLDDHIQYSSNRFHKMLIQELMTTSGVTFGTSGARGLAVRMTDAVCYAYTLAFIRYLEAQQRMNAGAWLGLAGDHRSSTPRIVAACLQAAHDAGYSVRFFGAIPTPALTAFGLAHQCPTLMITGSHIPDDRNGIKFNTPTGEILKHDEQGIAAQAVHLPEALFQADGSFFPACQPTLPPPDDSAYQAYVARFVDFFAPQSLAGLRIGLYEHSSVAARPLWAILTALGASVERLGYTDHFVPVDTEAIRSEDVQAAQAWCADGRFDALVSTDGDGDRPLISDEYGCWLRGDIAGILCAQALHAQAVVTPISSNSALERSGLFQQCLRTRIGSPYVIAGMQSLQAQGYENIVGYEANGGFLLQSEWRDASGRCLQPLPTRDAAIVLVTLLAAAQHRRVPISALLSQLPARFTYSDRLTAVSPVWSQAYLAPLQTGQVQQDLDAANTLLAASLGSVMAIDHTDGVRMTLATGEIVHIRASGNAPELRVYTEADSIERATDLNKCCLSLLQQAISNNPMTKLAAQALALDMG
jgi:phosphomannomutase